ncbi:DNA-binding transcriptional LysR family regulator [Pseudomonas nitritireducens]|uniref:DNA-binding transcriptional LysR family regulator n=1 Tax=Pseudomonas nitroreducens TaxID=46680 RepID=A0A7W7KMM4_PSENT|nr:LysR family transcriptional regulator [Pseudomonas nitritireducens]MBB4865630.1 DNA-binding transcriptional LysR family regulator [Pseudomonas nitritireducens]
MHVLHFLHRILNIVHASLRRLDLNLLLVFDALFRQRSVVAAADELAMSPSACSHALGRLRDSLGDELFVRAGSAMQPTAQAELMADGIGEALALLADRLSSAAPFDPAHSSQTFVFAATDYTSFTLLPGLIARIEKLAPHLRIKVIYATQQDSLDDLREGRVHFALGVSHQRLQDDTLEAIDCFSDDYVVAARKGHSRITGELSLEQYLAERHVAVLPWSDAVGVIDTALARQGIQRDVAVQLPSLLAAPSLVAVSDYLLTLPRRVAEQLNAEGTLALYPAPIELPSYHLRILYHPRHASRPGQRWLREQMLRALADT